jgi:hypothetical protein
MPPTCTLESKVFKAIIASSFDPLQTTSPSDAPEPNVVDDGAVSSPLLS